MLICGLDPGPTKVGWCLYETEGMQILEWGHDDWSKVKTIVKAQAEKCKSLKHIFEVAYEEVFFYTGPGNQKILPPTIEGIGRIKQICEDLNIDIYGIPRINIIEKIMGSRPKRNKKITKPEVRNEIYKQLNTEVRVKPLHAADALAVIIALYPPEAINITAEKAINENTDTKKKRSRRKNKVK